MDLLSVSQNKWSLWKKLLFRFFAVFVLLYIYPFPLSSIPWINKIGESYTLIWDTLVPWTGEHILSISYPITVKPNGSGDTTYSYVHLFLLVVISFLGSIIWSIIDPKRANYERLLELLTVWIRFYLLATMLSYGLYKVIKTQFPFPGLEQIVLPFGHSSPMGLAWKFMGYSNAYNIFTGMGEVVGALLLMHRKTTTLGAIILACVMSNVVMINYSYDVPVKIFSSVLLLFIVFLLLLNYKNLLNFLILNKATTPSPIKAHFEDKRFHIGGQVLKYLLVAGLIASNLNNIIPIYKKYGDHREKPPLYGIYEVDKFIKNGEELPPNLDDKHRWKRVIIDRPGYAAIHKMRDQRQTFILNRILPLNKSIIT